MTTKNETTHEDELTKALKNVGLPEASEKTATTKTNLTDATSAGTNSANPEFYNKAQKYWSTVPATVNGMLGGLGYISAIDIQGSNSFLRELRTLGNKCALDCGAGIGRVTKNLLMPRFSTVDMVEQDVNFTKTARDYCSANSENTHSHCNRLGEIYNVGLQQFSPEVNNTI